MTGLQSRQPQPVEADHQLRHRIATAAPGRTRRVSKALARSHRQERFGVRYVRRRLALRAADAHQVRMFEESERPQGLFLTAGHGRTPSRLDANGVLPFSLQLP
jgi:hypothetical protein